MNRVIRRTDEGWEIGPDERHADILVKELGLEDGRPVSTPGEAENKWEVGTMKRS